MKITTKQLRKIIEEQKNNTLNEANPDGTVSADEDSMEEELLAELEMGMDDLIQTVQLRAAEIGGKFRAPGIRARCYALMNSMLRDAMARRR